MGHTIPVGTLDTPDRLAVEDVRSFVGARDFAVSHRFYEALGWRTIWTDGSLALLELGDSRFSLQNHHVQQWAENTMLVIAVRDPSAWHEHAASVIAGGGFTGARVEAPKAEVWGAIVTYVWDPSGVLRHFTQFPRAE